MIHQVNSFTRLLGITVFVLLPLTVNAQDSRKADSLRQLLGASQLPDTVELQVLQGLMIYESKPSQALLYAQSFIALANELADIKKEALGWEEVSLIRRRLGDITTSTAAALRAQSLFKQQGLTKELAASYAQLASNLLMEARYVESLEKYNEALQIYKEEKDTVRTCLTLLNIGETYRLADQLDSALHYFQESLRINTSKNQIVHSYATGNLGLIYKAKGFLNQARPLLEESIASLSVLGDLYSVSVYSFELGDILIREGDQIAGEERMLAAYATVLNEGLKEQVRDFSQDLVSYYQSKGDFEKALHFQQQFQVYKDSLINIDNVRQVEELKAQNEVSQREAEITLLNQARQSQRQVLIGLSTGTVLLMLLLGLLYRNNQQKKKANVVLAQREREKALLLQELNHRTKNNLQMISSLLNLQSMSLEDHPAAEKVREGRYRVDSLALIHQKLYKKDYAHLDIKQYLEELIGHLSTSFDPLIQVEISIAPCQLIVDQAIPLALIINELLTNATDQCIEVRRGFQ